jgi:Domain of unknown function (DUF4350)
MKDRLFTFALAIGALAAFYALFFHSPLPSADEKVTRPLTTEAGPNGYLGLQRWLAAEKVPTVSLRERYGQLSKASPAPTGNLLITTMPHVYPLREAEEYQLQDWVAAGNTLLVVAGLSDTPDWSMGDGQDPMLLAHVERMTGLSFKIIAKDKTAKPDAAAKDESAAKDEASGNEHDATSEGAATDEDDSKRMTAQDAIAAFRRLGEPQRFLSAPNGSHPLLEGVESLLAISDYPTAQWRAMTSSNGVVLELASIHDSGVPSLWLVPYGQGQIIVSPFGSLFTNKVLGQQDNARLLANLTHWSLGAQGQVILDDAHQGLVSFYDPAKFFGDPRLHHTLWWLFAVWLLFVLGPRPLRAAVGHWKPIDVTSFVRATGGFMARVTKPVAVGERLFANFFNEIRYRLGLPCNGEPVWEWLGAQAAIVPGDLQRLNELHERVTRRRRIKLPELHNLLVRVRARLN